MVDRVRGLLRMAEDPSVTDEESQAFTAKAAELMTRHAIAEAEARAERGEEPEAISRMDFPVSGVGGHGKARVKALGAVAAAYGCQAAVRGNTSASTERTLIIVGTNTALDALRVLLPSISMRMESSARFCAREHIASIRALRNTDRSQLATERSRYYRSFLRAYGFAVAQRIKEFRARLREGADGAGDPEERTDAGGEEQAETSSRGAELVLREDVHRVQEEFQERFGQLNPTKPERTHHRAGARAGYLRGRSVELGIGTSVGSGGGNALPE
ncbi:DUF2786 domain-containing protein [Lipingzhangella rawalii]|nr:DUF2786 domain-containing protein [Lipingzhangella rawalii]